MGDDSLQRAINEPVAIVTYDAVWPERFEQEKSRIIALFPELLAVEHFGSTAVPGLPSKPIIDILATVCSMKMADALIPKFCENGYVTSPEFNGTLLDRRWLMRHSEGHRTHHLHLVLPNSAHWTTSLRFRNMLCRDPKLANNYAEMKKLLASSLSSDREAYTVAKTDFIERALSRLE